MLAKTGGYIVTSVFGGKIFWRENFLEGKKALTPGKY